MTEPSRVSAHAQMNHHFCNVAKMPSILKLLALAAIVIAGKAQTAGSSIVYTDL